MPHVAAAQPDSRHMHMEGKSRLMLQVGPGAAVKAGEGGGVVHVQVVAQVDSVQKGVGLLQAPEPAVVAQVRQG